MIDAIGAKAIQSMGIDIANLTSRLAVNTAIIDEIVYHAGEIDPTVWQNQQQLSDVGGQPTGDYTVTLLGSDAEKVQALLALIGSLQ